MWTTAHCFTLHQSISEKLWPREAGCVSESFCFKWSGLVLIDAVTNCAHRWFCGCPWKSPWALEGFSILQLYLEKFSDYLPSQCFHKMGSLALSVDGEPLSLLRIRLSSWHCHLLSFNLWDLPNRCFWELHNYPRFLELVAGINFRMNECIYKK